MKVLLLGGSRDGEWFDWPEDRTFLTFPVRALPVAVPFVVPFLESLPLEEPHHVEEYVLHSYSFDGREVMFACGRGDFPPNPHLAEIITRLMEGYKGKE
jgi:hypothetical protein